VTNSRKVNCSTQERGVTAIHLLLQVG